MGDRESDLDLDELPMVTESFNPNERGSGARDGTYVGVEYRLPYVTEVAGAGRHYIDRGPHGMLGLRSNMREHLFQIVEALMRLRAWITVADEVALCVKGYLSRKKDQAMIGYRREVRVAGRLA